jgi:prolyl-tRNA synthetase
MKWSKAFLQTLREDPADAESVSHKLMVRAGLVRQLQAGVYTFLPLGTRALHKISAIVRQEMDAAGAIELTMPVMQPAELWQETGRFDGYGEAMCKFKDRKGHMNVLGPTHEEVVTDIVRNANLSYRNLPINLYQIQVKFRDEARPRFGVVRTREFIMKDAYSFDADVEGLNRSYQLMYDAYLRIFQRCGLAARPVEADSGLIGGDASHEFMVLVPAGEDHVLTCTKCPYAANVEKAEVKAPAGLPADRDTTELKPRERKETPGKRTVAEVAAFLGVSPRDVVKTLLFKTEKGPLAALVRGDHEVNEPKLRRAARVEMLELATPEYIQEATGGPIGFSGPVGLKARVLADQAVGLMLNFVVGANVRDEHWVNVNLNRDFKPEGFADVRLAVEGDECPRCGGPIQSSVGVEVGHVFKLGTKYSDPMHCDYLDPGQQRKPMIMGCYGIGVTRILATAIESHHDQDGILWPKEIAPFQVELVTLVGKEGKVAEIGDDVYRRLTAAGLDVLWDDRDQAPGVKFKDADLLGIPLRVTIGKKSIEAGTADIRRRNNAGQKSVPLGDVVKAVQEEWHAYAV